MNGNGATPPGRLRYGSESEHRRERLPHGERLVVGRGVPLVAGDAAVENSGAGTDRHTSITAGIPRDTQARRDVVDVGLDDAAADAGIAREEQSFQGGGRHLRLRARHERELAVFGIGKRELQVVADAKIERHALMNAVIVLREGADVGAVIQLSNRRVLHHRRRQPEKEIGVGISGLAVVEHEHAVVVEQRVVHDLLVRDLATELERMISPRHAQAVFHREVVAAGVRSRN